jgi:protoheme ferro-lyase
MNTLFFPAEVTRKGIVLLSSAHTLPMSVVNQSGPYILEVFVISAVVVRLKEVVRRETGKEERDRYVPVVSCGS